MTNAETLGIACRFEGIEAVKSLLKRGAKFDETEGEPLYDSDHAVSLLNVSKQLMHGAYHLNHIKLGGEFIDKGKKYTLLPTSERIEIYRLLKENAVKCRFHSGRLFYYAILANDTEMIAAMRENGEALPDYLTDILTSGGRNAEWSEFCYTFEGMSVKEFFAVIGNISRELGGRKICFSYELLGCAVPIFSTPKGFDFILERFDQKKMNKRAMMKKFIDENNTGLLEVAANHGWLKIPQKRDEMIKYASDKGRTESLAWLLEFKNRTADLVKEQELAEKKMLRELNANPYSVTELKKSWSFVKNEDGTAVITGYKGQLSEITVPPMIGKNTVTEIGEAAFTSAGGFVHNVRHALLDFRRKITSVRLPESVEVIGNKAFAYCEELSEINIPLNLKTIGDRAFMGCHKLEKMIVPDTVTDIGDGAFLACYTLKTARLPIGLTVIREALFSQCYELECIVIPESVSKIENMAFHSCISLRFVVLPPQLTEIGYGSFSGCTKLEEIDIPKSVTAIRTNTFIDCHKLTAAVDKGSYAEEYCKENHIKFKYK